MFSLRQEETVEFGGSSAKIEVETPNLGPLLVNSTKLTSIVEPVSELKFVRNRKAHIRGSSVKFAFLKNQQLEYSLRDSRIHAKNVHKGGLDAHLTNFNSTVRDYSLQSQEEHLESTRQHSLRTKHELKKDLYLRFDVRKTNKRKGSTRWEQSVDEALELSNRVGGGRGINDEPYADSCRNDRDGEAEVFEEH